MLDEVGRLPVPVDEYPPVEIIPPCPHDNVLRELHEAFLKEWRAEQGPRPRILYHYTSLEGLAGILRLHRLRATDVAYMNDSLELQLASSLIAASLDEAARDASPIQQELLRRSRLDAKPTDLSRSFYVTCFCDDGDLLSQWRAYGANGGGYALGFSAYEIAWPGPCGLRRVIYDPAVQQRLVRGTIQRACGAFAAIAARATRAELDASLTFPAFASLLANHLHEFEVTFKHDTFAAEKEWRFIIVAALDGIVPHVQFRTDRALPIPYLYTPLRVPVPNSPLLPIVRVVHGPTVHPDLTKKSLHMLLQSTDYDHVEVGGSRSSLRA